MTTSPQGLPQHLNLLFEYFIVKVGTTIVGRLYAGDWMFTLGQALQMLQFSKRSTDMTIELQSSQITTMGEVRATIWPRSSDVLSTVLIFLCLIEADSGAIQSSN